MAVEVNDFVTMLRSLRLNGFRMCFFGRDATDAERYAEAMVEHLIKHGVVAPDNKTQFEEAFLSYSVDLHGNDDLPMPSASLESCRCQANQLAGLYRKSKKRRTLFS